MSLDKLKSGWNSLNDSVDQKGIVILRQKLKNSIHNGLKRKNMIWSMMSWWLGFLCPIISAMYFHEKINILAIIIYCAVGISTFIVLYFTNIEFIKIKMDDDIHALQKVLHKHLKYTQMGNIYLIIMFPIYFAAFIAFFMLPEVNNPIVILVIFALMICVSNCLNFYMTNKTNKKYNKILEDIKQLEELDMY